MHSTTERFVNLLLQLRILRVDTYQCKRRACRKAERPSMTSKMATVRVAKAANMKNKPNPPAKLRTLSPTWITMVQRTSESSGERKARREVAD